MALLGGLFSRRNAAQKHTQPTAESVASSASNRDSTDGDGDRLNPPRSVYNLPAAASSSKLRLPFRRRAAPARQSDTGHSAISLSDPAAPYISSVMSDSGHGLPPPPRKSSVFGAYSDSLPSVHSLPDAPSSRLHSDTPPRLSTDLLPKKSPGLFSWARERTKSKPTTPSPPTTSPTDDPASFNLKSFRHISADSSESPHADSNSLLPPVCPRPRGDSVASDSSQRISVAAFREAHARSRANSPVPSFRPPSAADTLRVDIAGRKRASTVSVVSPLDSPQPNKTMSAPLPGLRPGLSAIDTSSDDSDSEDDDDDEVDSDGEPIPKPPQNCTVTRRVGARARSDAGHGSVPASNNQMSQTRQFPPEPTKSAPPLTSHSDQAPAPAIWPLTSLSTNSATPNGAARAVSNLVPSTSHAQPKLLPRKPTDDTDESAESSDADSEDMPLRDLVAPRRPGSAASNYSNGRPRMPQKPLIDINALAGGPPLLTPILRHENSIKNMNMKHKEHDGEKDQPFSIPAAIAFSSSTSSPISPPPSKQDPMPVNRPASSAHHRRSSSDMPAPPKPKGPDNDDDLMNAIRLVGALDQESEQAAGALKPPPKVNPDRIVPTPIREREPPTSFTVLSRPPQRQSIAESISPSSQSLFSSPSRTVSPQSETSARQRVSAMTNPAAQGDRADALSVSTAQSSTSRSSSRIPPVPLIHSIPDSPSVKQEYKPGRPRTSSDGRSRTALAPSMLPASTKIPSRAQPASTSQRPFGSARGESPAGSSTGDSSSGRAPFTPRDGSDIGTRSKEDTGDMSSTVKARRHAKKLSVTFEDAPPGRGRERAKTDLSDEQRIRERRRSEAKAAIELGKIVNGRGPLVHDDSDEDMGLRGRNPTINVTMDGGASMPPFGWQQPMATGMSATMVPPQFNNDPAFIAAHQRALLYAKQAYQMAVAQHAMQVAGEEWERSSNVGFSSAGSAYGGGSVYGGGGGGSVYGGGGGSGGSVYGGMAGPPMGMMGMPSMGMLMPPPNTWGRSSVTFPSSGASVYGMGSSQSEWGGGGGAGGWGTRSVYGDPSFRPSSSHGNLMMGSAPSGTASVHGGSARPRASTGAAPPSALSGQPRTPGKGAARNRAAPPSSWKSGR